MENYWIPFILSVDEDEDENKPMILVGNKVKCLEPPEGNTANRVRLGTHFEVDDGDNLISKPMPSKMEC